MNHRKLRIAWSVAWAFACQLLFVVWVLSYSWVDRWDVGLGRFGEINLAVIRGRIVAVPNTGGPQIEWSTKTYDHILWNEWDQTTPTWSFGESHQWIVPCWLPVLIAGLLVPMPWIPWSRRFSLRTLLIATTLVAVGLGIVAWML